MHSVMLPKNPQCHFFSLLSFRRSLSPPLSLLLSQRVRSVTRVILGDGRSPISRVDEIYPACIFVGSGALITLGYQQFIALNSRTNRSTINRQVMPCTHVQKGTSNFDIWISHGNAGNTGIITLHLAHRSLPNY